MSLLGENVGVGGRGELDILRKMNSLTAFDTKGFEVNVGDVQMRFMGKGYSIPRKHSYENSFAIDDISMTMNGRSLEGRYQIKKENERYLVDDNKRVVGGREVFSGPVGISGEVYFSLNGKDYKNLKRTFDLPSLFSSDKETLVDHLMRDRFSLHVDLNSPQGIKVEGVVGELINRKIEARVYPFLQDPTGLAGYRLSQKTFDTIKKIVISSTQDLDVIETGKISIEIRNNPVIDPSNSRLRTVGDPSLLISTQSP